MTTLTTPPKPTTLIVITDNGMGLQNITEPKNIPRSTDFIRVKNRDWFVLRIVYAYVE